MNNNAQASPLWTTQQQAWLRALGHTVWLYGSVPTALPLPKSPPVHSVAFAPLTDHQASTSNAVQPTEERPQASTAPSTPVFDGLLLSLIRASGMNPNQAPIHQLIARWPIDELRASPAAKRAFWPQLRTLRRQQRQS